MAKLVPLHPVHGDFLARLTGTSVAAEARTETLELTRKLAQRHRASPYHGPDLIDRLSVHLIALLPQPLPPVLAPHLTRCARSLVALEAPVFAPPTAALETTLAGARHRALLRQRLEFFDHAQERVAGWITALAQSLTSILAALPPLPTETATLSIDVPLASLINEPHELFFGLVSSLLAFAPDPSVHPQPIIPGARLGELVCDNLLRVSKLAIEVAQKHPERLRFPSISSGNAGEITASYLAHTPFIDLLTVTIALPVPIRIRMEHCHIQARIGFGKSQKAQAAFIKDVDDPSRPAVVWIDSQGDAIDTLSHLARFDPAHDDRLILLDPADTEFPLRLNIVDIDRARIDRLPLGQREEILAGIIDVYEFIFSKLLISELTGRQSLVVRMLAQLMLEIPNATIHSLIELLQDPTPFLPHVARLPVAARVFITQHLFADRQYAETRKQIVRRLFHILSNPLFERMMSHPRNGLDMRRALDSGKVILINTAKARLKSEWSSIFGRYMIAIIRQAAFLRADTPEHLRRPAFVTIEEAYEYFDENIDDLLKQARKYKVALTLINHTTEQLKTGGLKGSIIGMPALRFTGELSAADAAVFAPEMKTTPQFLMSVRKTETSAEFAAHVRNLTPHAVKVTVPFLTAERAPRMSDAAYQRLLARSRAQVATPIASVTEPQRAAPIHTNIPEPDDFADHY